MVVDAKKEEFVTVPPPAATGLALLKQALDLPEKILDLGCGLVRDLVGEPVKVAGGMLGDQVYWWQWRNRVRIASRAAEIIERDGIARRIVPPSFLLPLLDDAGNVEDPDLQAMWARLLASGVAADEHQHPMWIKILAQMSAEDARKFASICAHADALGTPFGKRTEPPLFADDAPDDAEARLASLGLIIPYAAETPEIRLKRGNVFPDPESSLFGVGALPTRLGARFRRAVVPTTGPRHHP